MWEEAGDKEGYFGVSVRGMFVFRNLSRGTEAFAAVSESKQGEKYERKLVAHGNGISE